MFLLINLVTEVSSLAGAFFQHLFGLLMAGYQIPISLSCGWPSRWPAQRRSLEENRAEVSIWRKPCWMGPFIPEPALQRAQAEWGWGPNSVPLHFSTLLTPFLYCHLLLSSSSHLSLLFFSERLSQSLLEVYVCVILYKEHLVRLVLVSRCSLASRVKNSSTPGHHHLWAESPYFRISAKSF